ncbi:MAG: ABC transporter substrate-binding protein [Bacteroidetes bacterium]|nr:ABC transporter substrate-binding protein [Bacteroidota bacterium]
MKLQQVLFGSVLTLSFAACGGGSTEVAKDKGKNEVVMHQLGDPETLNPLLYKTIEASYVMGQLFESLLTYDPKTYAEKPYLAKALPEVKVNADSSMDFVFEIRNEATWTDGSPITANDALFSLKLIKNPFVDCAGHRAAYELFDDIIVDPSNNRKFTLHCTQVYHIAELTAGGLTFYNSKVFDPKGILASYSLKELSQHPEKFDKDAKLKEQGDFINTSFTTSLPADAGSSAYSFEKFVPTQRVVLKRNANWWGYKIKGEEDVFYAYPDKLIFETNTNVDGAIVALKGGELDAMERIPNRSFVQDMLNNPELQQKLYMFTPVEYGYEYICINTKNAKLQDVKVRRALSHLIDIDKIIDATSYGLAEKATSFVPKDLKEFYNSSLKYPEYNIETAKALLLEAGWKDSNGDGVVDKIINGEKVELTLNIGNREGREWRGKVALYFQAAAKKAGIAINIQTKEWGKLIEEMYKHEFELLIIGVSGAPFEHDYKDQWHTSAYNSNGGGNVSGFGNAKSDALIDQLRVTMDKKQRAVYYMELQKMVSEELPVLFLINEKARIAVNKRWNNVYPTGLKPGFMIAGFKLN